MSQPGVGAGHDDGAKVPIGLVLDGSRPPAWQARVVEILDSSRTLVVERLQLTEDAGRDTMTRRLRAALERHVFSIAKDPTRPMEVASRRGGREPRLTLWLAERHPPERLDGVAILLHGGRLEPAESACWRALLRQESYLTSELVLTRSGVSHSVASTVSELRPYSEAVSRSLALWKLAALVPRSLERLLGGASSDAKQAVRQAAVPVSTSRPVTSELRLLWSSAARAARAALTRAFFRRPWSIAVATTEPGRTSTGIGTETGLVSWGRARMYADPLLFEHEGRHHLFCEEVPAGEKHGVISHTELCRDGGSAATPQPVLRANHHLSYPFVFAHEGDIFMIPETSAARRVELYRAAAFPGKWEREAILLDDLDAADTTLLVHDGVLWLFLSVAAPGASTLDELHLFWARELRGPWQPHPLNPVVSDARCARPAGRILRTGARLIRPAQDCSRRYGWAISFREIDLLSTSAYAEHEIDRLEPSALAGARAVHTYSSDSRFQAWDVRRREARLAWPANLRDSWRRNATPSR